MTSLCRMPFVLSVFSLAGCGGGSVNRGVTTSSGQKCASVKSILKASTLGDKTNLDAQTGLLLTTHRELPPNFDFMSPLSEKEVLTQCNVAMELLQAEPPRIRVWTASHCIKPLLITSMRLAIRDVTSETGGFFQWVLDHKVLRDGEQMREAYNFFNSQASTRTMLMETFDRRKMYVEGSNAVLTPRVSCENLRWSLQADDRHSLCFSIFDLMSIDLDVPESNSNKTKALVAALQVSKKSPITEQQIAEKRATFLRRINLTSQVGWIVNQGWQLSQSITYNGKYVFPSFTEQAYHIEKLNRSVFSLPHEEEMSALTPENVPGQDAIPPALNQTYSIAYRGNYVSPRMTVNNVQVKCQRLLQRFNSLSGKVEPLPELEVRPREFCLGGSQFQADHFWERNREWSHMVADLSVGASHEFSQAIYNSAAATTNPNERLDRFNIVSTFDLKEDLGFQSTLLDLSNPLLKHLQLPLRTVTRELYGFETLSQTGAFMLSLPMTESQARFLKGDSGSILLLDGIPIATLFSVDGEETSGGTSITALPELVEDDALNPDELKRPNNYEKVNLQQKNCLPNKN